MKRRTVREIGNVKKRRHGKYAIDIVAERDCEVLCLIFGILWLDASDDDEEDDYFMLLATFASHVEDIQRDIRCITTPIERVYLRIDDIHLNDVFTINFRFKKENMIRLLQCLRIPPEFKLDNGSWVNGQEGLLIFLKLFAYPQRLVENEVFCGWEYSRLSRIFSWIRSWIYNHHRYLVTDNLDWHARLLESSKQAMQAYKRSKHPLNLLNERTQNCCGFYDGMRVAICRPQSSTNIDENGNIIHLNIQAEVYTGHIKVN